MSRKQNTKTKTKTKMQTNDYTIEFPSIVRHYNPLDSLDSLDSQDSMDSLSSIESEASIISVNGRRIIDNLEHFLDTAFDDDPLAANDTQMSQEYTQMM